MDSIRIRLEALKYTPKGFVPISFENIEWLQYCFDAFYPIELPIPSVYPMHCGKVALEWDLPSDTLSLEIDAKIKKGMLSGLFTPAVVIDCNSSLGWYYLRSTIKKIVNPKACKSYKSYKSCESSPLDVSRCTCK